MQPDTHLPTNTGLIAFGSNQGDSLQVFQASIDALQRIAGITVVSHSEPIWTAPVTGRQANPAQPTAAQTPYLNAVIRIHTRLNPTELHLQSSAIEHQFGRIRTGRWQARTIDLDLLLLGDHIVDTRWLKLPHPRMSFRRFVLEPAAEIAADLRHPTSQCSIADLLNRINLPVKTMALASPSSEIHTVALEKLTLLLSKQNPQWQFKKIFSTEKLFLLDANLTMVVAFDSPTFSTDDDAWQQLKEHAARFAGPTLHIKHPADSQVALTELSAALQTIGQQPRTQ